MWEKIKSFKSLLIGIVVVIVLAIMIFKKQTYLQLKNTDFVVEYGGHISMDIQDYLDFSECTEIQKREIIDSAKLNLDISHEQDKDYPAIGSYYADISYNKEDVQFHIIVKDTIAPEFQNFKETIVTDQGVQPDFPLFYYAYDLSQVEITCDDRNVEYGVIGEYTATIKATDTSGNVASQDIHIKVVNHMTSDYVNVKDYIPSVYVDLKYATADNFTGQVIYDFHGAYLRYGTVKKLMKVQEVLNKKGYSLLIWDAYRPFDAQKKLWSVVSDSKYVANPSKGPKRHNLGGTIDISLVKRNGDSLVMPTNFDDFSQKADRDYSDLENQEAVRNAKLLGETMEQYGFKGYVHEWWDYSDTTTYPYVDFHPQS